MKREDHIAPKRIRDAQARRRLVIIDVRLPDEYREAQVEPSRLIPLGHSAN